MSDEKKSDQVNEESKAGGEVSEVSKDNSKRKTLRNILMATGALAGSQALPSKWSKPVLDSVVLPAHAQVTGPTVI